MSSLYYIYNEGCDAATSGLARISDEDFPKFKEIIENLNENSFYGCMPKISVYKISEDDIREVEDGEDVTREYKLYFEGKIYILVNTSWSFMQSKECVI